jgi:hypothetical protein
MAGDVKGEFLRKRGRRKKAGPLRDKSGPGKTKSKKKANARSFCCLFFLLLV